MVRFSGILNIQIIHQCGEPISGISYRPQRRNLECFNQQNPELIDVRNYLDRWSFSLVFHNLNIPRNIAKALIGIAVKRISLENFLKCQIRFGCCNQLPYNIWDWSIDNLNLQRSSLCPSFVYKCIISFKIKIFRSRKKLWRFCPWCT